MTPSTQQLPEEVEKMLRELAYDAFPDLDIPGLDKHSIKQANDRIRENRSGYLDGATAALTNPSIYEKAGLMVKEEYLKEADEFLRKPIDASDWDEEDKKEYIRILVQAASLPILNAFVVAGLKTHIETMVINQSDGKEYILTFHELSYRKSLSSQLTTANAKIKELEEQVKKSGWLNAEKNKPKDNERIIIKCENGLIEIGNYLQDFRDSSFILMRERGYVVTHWLRLP